MPRKVSLFALHEEPIRWGRSFIVGAVSAIFLMGFMDIFYMLGITRFSFEMYVGALLTHADFGHHTWTIGFLANLILGGIFGSLYAYCFEYVFYRSAGRLGVALGLAHAAIAAFAVFPFFNAIGESLQLQRYAHFGVFGSGLGAPTFILLILGHLLFGASMGTLYGPAREDRIQSHFFEPGDTDLPVDEDEESRIISDDEDPWDRQAV